MGTDLFSVALEKNKYVPIFNTSPYSDPACNALDVPGFEEFATWYGDKDYG
jgi:hypothetical protein